MPFRVHLRVAAEAGILLFVKWGLVVALVLGSVDYLTKVRTMAINGQNAAAAILEYQRRGQLPPLTPPSGVVK